MNITNKTILITGANRGIGNALVKEALKRGAKTIYAGTRVALDVTDKRIVPLRLDITDTDLVQKTAKEFDKLDILINNAGIALYDDLSDSSILAKHLAVNLYGTQNVTNAFLPALKNAQGAIVNILSILALAPLPPIASYSVSKAAAFSMTQSLRALLKRHNVRVHAVLAGLVDTDMTRGMQTAKEAPAIVAQNIFDGIEKQEEDIFPDSVSISIGQSWKEGSAKAMERENAKTVQS